VQAAKRVLEVRDDVKFVVAGSGDQAARMIQMAADLGIGDRMLFTGFLRGKDIARVFAMADLYVMPSVSEPFGIAPLEAMGHNVPVLISSRTPSRSTSGTSRTWPTRSSPCSATRRSPGPSARAVPSRSAASAGTAPPASASGRTGRRSPGVTGGSGPAEAQARSHAASTWIIASGAARVATASWPTITASVSDWASGARESASTRRARTSDRPSTSGHAATRQR
jgi:hypothetical protein